MTKHSLDNECFYRPSRYVFHIAAGAGCLGSACAFASALAATRTAVAVNAAIDTAIANQICSIVVAAFVTDITAAAPFLVLFLLFL